MRTDLSNIMKALQDGIMDDYCFGVARSYEKTQVNFFIHLFPLYFIKHPKNMAIFDISQNNSSRLSNIFTRRTEPSRRESKFRDRFVESFDETFIDEMILNSKFVLRNYNKEKYNQWINNILITDTDLKHTYGGFFFEVIKDNYIDNPSIALAILLVWAFHIDNFEPIIIVFEKYLSSCESKRNARYTGNAISNISELIESRKMLHSDVYDFLFIALTYGVCSQLGAIAIKSYVETHSHINPIISTELGSMHFYGNNFKTANYEKAMRYFKDSASQNYGPALWTIGFMIDNEPYNVEYRYPFTAYHYYDKAISMGHFNSYNNIGKWWITAFHYHLAQHFGFDYYRNIFANKGRQCIADLYQCLINETSFIEFLKNHDLFDLDKFDSKELYCSESILSKIEMAEEFIIEHVIMQGYYKQKYFYSIGSALSVYMNQLDRRNLLAKSKVINNNDAIAKSIMTKYKYLVYEYSKHHSVDSHIRFADYLLNYSNDEEQTAYEYLYKAAFEMPGKLVNHEVNLKLAQLHLCDKVIFKKHDLSITDLIINAIKGYKTNIHLPSKHVFDSTTLLIRHFTPDLIDDHMNNEILKLIENEGSISNNGEEYRDLHNKFMLFKKNR